MVSDHKVSLGGGRVVARADWAGIPGAGAVVRKGQGRAGLVARGWRG